MPKLENVVLLHLLQAARSTEGSVPALHDSHAVCFAFAILPASLHRVHALPKRRTVPGLHLVQLLLAELSLVQSRCGAEHCVPTGQTKGTVQDDCSELIILGAMQSEHNP
jgi:hypothetical protein